ncbi:MAG: CotH kinase family protein [Alistipes sp.]|nr:CotH kinase family protein [Alistipes sp.]
MKKSIIILLSALICCISCSKIDDLENRVNAIEKQIGELQSAYQNGKIIKEVTPYVGDDYTGWTISFSDGQSINIYNGNDGADAITPIFRINSEGFWEVSYDNGESFSLLTDKEGNGVTGKGVDGVSVRVVISEDGRYVFELYQGSNPEDVIESIETPISSSKANSIKSIVKDEYTGVIYLEMADGTKYEFNLDVTYPTGIVILAETVILPRGGETTFKFRVNPSNAVVDLCLEQDTPMLQLDMAIEEMTRSYVTQPEYYSLDKLEACTDDEGNILDGQYIAYVKDLGVATDYCQGATLVLNTKNGKGEKMQVSSDIFKIQTPDKPMFTSFIINKSSATNLDKEFISVQLPYGTDVTSLSPDFTVSEGTVSVDGVEVKPYTQFDFSSPIAFVITGNDGTKYTYFVSISYSNLPVVYINTKDAAPIVSKEEWLKGSDIYITNAGNYNKHYEKSQIRGRGNTTWNYPKKPYAIKLDSKEEVLGMPKHKRWVLLANYVDKTCIRNSIAFEIARMADGLDYTPRGKHVDVVLNGVFLGNYYLCEQIKIDKNRVNISEMETTDVDAESITGGYLLEIDKNFDEVNKFYSPIRNRPFMIKEPDEDVLNADQFAYIQNYVTEIENALYGEGSTTEGYLQYIDLDSFIDYWLVYEITGTGEPTHPKSVYMYKDRGGKMHAGPVWDFDYFTFQPYYNTMLINTNAVWNDRIINDPATMPVIKQRWNANREKFRSIAEEIDRQYEAIKESAEYNSQLWPLSMNINRDDELSVKDAVARMKGYYMTKFEYMDGLYKY